MARQFIARVRAKDQQPQSLEEHLLAVACLASKLADRVGLPLAAYLAGLLHDFGKYQQEFQNYLSSAAGLISPDDPAYIDPLKNKGKIDHSTVGARLLWEYYLDAGRLAPLGQIPALAVCSHHSGLVDSLHTDRSRSFSGRMYKKGSQEALAECWRAAPLEIMTRVEASLNQGVLEELCGCCRSIGRAEAERAPAPGQAGPPEADYAKRWTNRRANFKIGLLARFLFSCLLEADRVNSIEFDDPDYKYLRQTRPQTDWSALAARLEGHLAGLAGNSRVDVLRRQVSETCRTRGGDAQGLFFLTVPTGGGKTLASLRFALAQAKKHGLERIIYVIPYTSIIEQNADTTRKILEDAGNKGQVVLEHHCNFQPDNEEEAEWYRLVSQNWDTPVVFTTMVQFLDALFAGGTQSARRMQALARSVLIFDEIQTLPVKCVHMFCNAINFLLEQCGVTALMCTATQPLLDRLEHPEKGQLPRTGRAELMPDLPGLFQELKRVEFVRRKDDLSAEEISALALEETRASGSCLVIVNTRAWAGRIFDLVREAPGVRAFYLSTWLCPVHRLEIIENIKTALVAGQPVLVVSTQLIECGVDLDFGAVIRFAAGLDSVLQAAGRCNRHGARATGRVHIVSPDKEEHLDNLPDIKRGRAACLQLLNELDKAGLPLTLDAPDLIERYFHYYFYAQQNEMVYRHKLKDQDSSLLDMLADHPLCNVEDPRLCLRQPFRTAGQAFRVIEETGRGVIVPYDERGQEIIAGLCSDSERGKTRDLLREAQRYTVSIHEARLAKLLNQGIIYETRPETGIYWLNENHYDAKRGLRE